VLRRLTSACALGVAALATSPAAPAQTASGTAGALALRSVEIVVVGSEHELEAIRATLGESSIDGATVRWSRATRLELDAVLERRPEASDVGVRAWIDLGGGEKAAFYFADRAGEHFLVRTLPLPDGLTALSLESVAQVLELSVRALLEDASVGMSRVEIDQLLSQEVKASDKPEPPATDVHEPKSASDEETTRSSLGGEVFYGARLFSEEVSFVHGLGLGLAWSTGGTRSRSLVWATGQYDLPRRFDTPEVSVEWTTVRLEGGLGLGFAVAPSGPFLGGRLGGGAEFTSFFPRAGTTSDGVTVEPPGVSVAPVVSLAFEATFPLDEHVAASVRLFGSFYPVRVHFDIADADGRSEVLAPYRIRPGVELALQLH
jgi:hypothetical protein